MLGQLSEQGINRLRALRFVFGVGVVPVAFVATIVHGYWSTLGDLVLGKS